MIKMLSQKNNQNVVSIMEWSNKMDLIALASDTGE
jgi:hypothetical protein